MSETFSEHGESSLKSRISWNFHFVSIVLRNYFLNYCQSVSCTCARQSKDANLEHFSSFSIALYYDGDTENMKNQVGPGVLRALRNIIKNSSVPVYL